MRKIIRVIIQAFLDAIFHWEDKQAFKRAEKVMKKNTDKDYHEDR